jgi:hypothetical protein
MATRNAGTLKVLRDARVFGGANATRPPTSAHVSATSSVERRKSIRPTRGRIRVDVDHRGMRLDRLVVGRGR